MKLYKGGPYKLQLWKPGRDKETLCRKPDVILSGMVLGASLRRGDVDSVFRARCSGHKA